MSKKFKSTTVGIMISKKEISIAAIEEVNKKYQLRDFMNTNILNDRDRSLSSLLKKFRSQLPNKIKSTVLGICSNDLLIKNISLDVNLKDFEIYKYVQLNTIKWFGTPSSELFIDYAPTSNKKSIQQTYRVSAVLKKLIVPIKKVCRTTNFKLIAIDSEPYTTARALFNLLGYKNNRTIAVIILSTRGLRLNVIHQNHISFMRFESYQNSTIAAVYRALQYYLTSAAYQALTDIVLVGDISNARSLVMDVKKFTGISACIANIALNKKYYINFTPTLLNAYGAAMRRFLPCA